MSPTRPAAPTAAVPPPPSAPAALPEAASDADDDLMAMPAVDAATAFRPRAPSPTAAAARAAVARRRNLEYRRTMIPILLTLGTWMAAFALAKVVAGPTSMFSAFTPGIAIALAAGAALLWGLAAANMLSVRATLAAARA